MELVYILAMCIKGSNILIKMQINIVEISHNCNRMSSSHDFTSLYSITLSSCRVSAAALLGDINIQLQKLSNQIKFLLYFLQMTFEKDTVYERNQSTTASITQKKTCRFCLL